MLDKDFPPDSIQKRVVDVLKTCYDPEIPVNIYEMGLVYDVAATQDGTVEITMTLTSPACPVAGTLPAEVERKIRTQVEGVSKVEVRLAWDPPWTADMMSDAAKLQLGMM